MVVINIPVLTKLAQRCTDQLAFPVCGPLGRTCTEIGMYSRSGFDCENLMIANCEYLYPISLNYLPSINSN